jgi:hypothetical protein
LKCRGPRTSRLLARRCTISKVRWLCSEPTMHVASASMVHGD